MHNRFDGPTRRCPSSQPYSIVAPTSNPLAATIVEFGGCSGRPQAFGSVNFEEKKIPKFNSLQCYELKKIKTFWNPVHLRCWQMKFNGVLQLVSLQSHPFEPSNRAQFSSPPGKFQNETVTSSPPIHFHTFRSLSSRTAPIQYCEETSLRWRRHNSQLMNPCNAGLLSFISVPPRERQNCNASRKLSGWRL